MMPSDFHEMVKAYSPYPTEVDPEVLDSFIDFKAGGPSLASDRGNGRVSIVLEFRRCQIVALYCRIQGRENLPKEFRVEYLKPGSLCDWLDPVPEEYQRDPCPGKLLKVPPLALQPANFFGLRLQCLTDDGRPELIDVVGLEIFGVAVLDPMFTQ
jgi:hypothetical protein